LELRGEGAEVGVETHAEVAPSRARGLQTLPETRCRSERRNVSRAHQTS
jgi:hypothetical protein